MASEFLLQYNTINKVLGDSLSIAFKVKHYFYNAFREVFIYHHNSLEFRAKVFALMIAANDKEHTLDCAMKHVLAAGMLIYKNEDRANTLALTTKEYCLKVYDKNGLNIDDLIEDITKELHQVPRYINKIDIEHLKPILECTMDEEISTYQYRILEFLQTLKEDYHETV